MKTAQGSKMSSLSLSLALVLLLALALLTSNLRAESLAQEAPPPIQPAEQRNNLPFLDAEQGQREPPVESEALSIVPWSKLVYQSYRNHNWEIYLADGDGANEVRLTNRDSSDIHPRLNRGCTHVAFASNRNGNYEIYTINPVDLRLTQLTFDGADDVQPAWSPDGTRIAFQSYRNGQAEVYVMNADGSGQTRLTWDGAYDGEPIWSPDGSQLAFTSNRTGQYQIWVMNADGSGLQQLSTQPNSENPTWSPDGSRIAYDSDGDGDGWQELWLMNADGTDQHQMYDPGSQRDAWARSWSPDGQYVAFTRISFIFYQGNWYWTEAYLNAWHVLGGFADYLGTGKLEWRPDLQTTDASVPESSVAALPAQSPGPFTVNWSGFDPGPSGLKNYDVQIREGIAGAWTDWQVGTTATSASYPGVGGHTYYFRSRARDNSYNVEPWPLDYDTQTQVEALPPRTVVNPLPAYSHNGVSIRWGGSDPGGSGIQTYDVQYRDSAIGSWTDWQMGTTETEANFVGTLEHTYAFRSRATDLAQNVESWLPGDGDTSTTLYTWAVNGTVRDNAGTPVTGASATTTPAAFVTLPSNGNGAYAAYVASSAASYKASWGKSGYGDLPATSFSANWDAGIDVYLPPADNVVLDWGFESGSMGTEWLATGVFTPVVTDTIGHTGGYAALLGEPLRMGPLFNLSNTDLWADYPELAIGQDGTVHLAWQEWDPGVYHYYYKRRSNDETWSASESLPMSSVPKFVVDGNGVLHAVWWEHTAAGQGEIFYAWRSDGSAWSSPQNISNTPNDSLCFHVAIGRNNEIHIVWLDETTVEGELDYVRRDASGTWSSPLSISGDTRVVCSLQLAVDKYNTVHVVWPDYNSSLYYSGRDSSGTWSAPELFATAPPTDPKMAVGEDGKVHVVWYEWVQGAGYEVYYIQRDQTGTWSEPMELSGDVDGIWPAIATDGQGNVHVLWVTNGIYHVWKGAGGLWSSPYRLSQDIGVSSFRQMAIDDSGTVHVTWGHRPSEHSWDWEIYYAQKDDRGWSDPLLVSDDVRYSSSSIEIPLVTDKNGRVHIVWVDQGDGYSDIMYTGSNSALQSGESTIHQMVTVPFSASTPILSFIYQLGGASATNNTWLNVQADNGIATTTFFSTTTNTDAWTHHWSDLSPWAGQTITLTFNVHETEGRPYAWAYLDEVTVGSAYPDLWIHKSAPAALPGQQVAFTLTYGNRGGAPASGVHITDTLPTELTFVAASPPPLTTTPALVWDVGDLAAKSDSLTIAVTATVSPATPVLSSLTNTASIGASSPELEAANNEAQVTIFVGRRIYLPLTFREY